MDLKRSARAVERIIACESSLGVVILAAKGETMSSAKTVVFRTDIQESATAEKRATREVQLSVLKKLHPDLDLTDKGDDYVEGYFDQAMQDLGRQSQAKPSTKLDSMGSRRKTKLDLVGSRVIKVLNGAVSKDRVRSRQDSAGAWRPST